MNSLTLKSKFLQDTMTNPQNPINQQFHVFVFVNSKSGSWHGRQILQKYRKSSFIHNECRLTHFYACDLYICEQKDFYFAQINRLALIGENVKIIMSGGDGTIQWVLSEALQYKIDFQKVVFGVLPIGTGNDFAKSIGWDRFKFKINDKKMQQLAVLLFQSQIGYYDVWQCTVKTKQSGKIVEIKNGIQNQLINKCFVKSFTNYFGIGSDAKITFIAQKINAKSVFAKKLSYTVAWFCSLISPSQKLRKVLKSFVKYKSYESKIISSEKQFELKNSLRMTEAEDKQLQSIDVQIGQNDSCVTFLNSTVSMELENIWKTPHSIVKNRSFDEQKIDDGMIEVVSYRNSMSIGLERAIHMAKKVQQGTGPFVLNFKEVQNQTRQTFIQVNGQPYKITNCDSISIRKNKQLAGSRLKVVILKK